MEFFLKVNCPKSPWLWDLRVRLTCEDWWSQNQLSDSGPSGPSWTWSQMCSTPQREPNLSPGTQHVRLWGDGGLICPVPTLEKRWGRGLQPQPISTQCPWGLTAIISVDLDGDRCRPGPEAADEPFFSGPLNVNKHNLSPETFYNSFPLKRILRVSNLSQIQMVLWPLQGPGLNSSLLINKNYSQTGTTLPVCILKCKSVNLKVTSIQCQNKFLQQD